jgi:hypothetical protein
VADSRRKLYHFHELGLADHLTVGDSATVVNTDVVEQSPDRLNLTIIDRCCMRRQGSEAEADRDKSAQEHWQAQGPSFP